jgi:hypothetical protein
MDTYQSMTTAGGRNLRLLSPVPVFSCAERPPGDYCFEYRG